MNTESFVMYESVYKQAALLERRLGKEAAYDFLKAVSEFGLYGVLPDEDAAVWLYGFEQTITSISRAKDRYTAAVENGKKGGRKPTIDRAKALALKEQGLTNKQVAEQLNCSVSTIEKINAENRKNQKNPNVNDNDNDNINEKENDNINDNINENQKAIEIVRSLLG